MVNYSNSKVYKIVSSQTDKIYIGSTTKKYLSQRMDGHRHDFKKHQEGKRHEVTSGKLLQFDDATIVLLKAFPNCKSKDELRSKEQYYLEQNRDICVNKCNAIGLDKNNAKKYKQEYYLQNKDAHRAYYKNYYHTNAAYNAKQKEKVVCECGQVRSSHNLKRHLDQDSHWETLHDKIHKAYLTLN
jgi:hypothetical protein